jgi:polyisoprenoid-binding protein YceI
MSRAIKIAIGVVAIVIVAAVGGYLWYALRDDTPPKETLQTASQSDAGKPLDSLDGTWVIKNAPPTIVNYRIDETLTGIDKHTAGGTSAVTGSATIAGTSVNAMNVDVDMTTVKSDESRRDNTLKTRGLQTEQFPTASFKLTEPINFGTVPAPGATTNVTATGDLTLHGVTKSVQVPVQVVLTNNGTPQLEVLGNVPIVLADYGMQPPDVGGFVSVEDHGTIELHLFLTRQSSSATSGR